MPRRQKSDDNVPAAGEAKPEEVKSEEAEPGKGSKAEKEQEPLDPATLKPEAAKWIENGEDAKQKLEVAAVALEILGLEGGAKLLWQAAMRAYATGEREARRIQKSGSKEAREAAKKEKKQQKIVKLREQLERLMADEAEAASDT